MLTKQSKIIFAVLFLMIVILAFAMFAKIRLQQNPVEVPIQQTVTDVTADNSPILNLFENQESRYRIRYPSNWIKDEPSPGTTVFSGKSGTPSFYSTINIQAILTKKMGGDYKNIKEFIADIKKQAKEQSNNVKFLEEKPFSITDANNQKLKGASLLFTYEYRGIAFKQWQIVVLRHDAQIFYAWAFTAPIQQYNADISTAKAMLDTWTIY